MLYSLATSVALRRDCHHGASCMNSGNTGLGTISMSGGYLRLGYSGGAAGDTTQTNNDDNPANAASGDIQFIAAESFIPEPTSVALLACAALPLLGRSRRRN